MTDVDEGLLRLKAEIEKRHAESGEPVILEVPAEHLERMKSWMDYLSVPPASYVLREETSALIVDNPRPINVERASAAMVVAMPYLAIERRRAPNEDRVDELLGRYRHNDPAAAARIREERLARRRAKQSGSAR